MNAVAIYVTLLAAHFIGDFVLQTHWQASNKSKRLDALVRHVFTYTAFFGFASVALFGAIGGPFAAVNGLAHLATDYFTSRLTARLYGRQEWHDFFVAVGADQLLHQATIALTMALMIGAQP